MTTSEKRRSTEWWASTVEQIQKSGKPLSEACASHGIASHQYYYWRRRVAEKKSPSGHKAAFYAPVEVSLYGEIEVRSTNGRSMIVRGLACAGQVREVLRALEGES